MLGPTVIGGGGGGRPGAPGAAARENEFGVHAGFISSRFIGQGDDDWVPIIAVADLVGEAGNDGVPPELQKTATHLQWRVDGGAWANLVALVDITGPAGGRLVLKGSVQLTANNAAYDIVAAAPAGSTHVTIEAVGGGASGMAMGAIHQSACGGMPGAVERSEMLALTSITAPVSVTIGAGGASYTTTATAYFQTTGNSGGETRVGDLVRAVGGPGYGGYSNGVSALLFLSSTRLPSMPGWSDTTAVQNGRSAISGAAGPGGGGASGPGFLGNSTYGTGTGGAGGEGNRLNPGKTTAGGAGGIGGAGAAGSNAADHFSYGGGGGGGGSTGGANSSGGGVGGAGGFPGGGGGGAGRGAASGAGGAGAVRLFFYGAP